MGVDVALSDVLAFAEKHGVNRIVMSTARENGPGGAVFGSVADKILRAADTTMVLVRPRTGATGS
jgi:nucleotide-binding universal stress UspA family protein